MTTALQIASAMGAEVYALSHSDSKLQDAQKLGVKPENFIITKDVKEVAKKYNKHFDILLNTSSGSSMPLETLYFPLLNNLGALVLCGLPEDKLPPFYVHVSIHAYIYMIFLLVSSGR
jgi:alcohol dehydrogenase (NADP+)